MTLPFLQSPRLAALPGVRHGFFGREGGVSAGLYTSLNAGPGSKDDPAAVAENRRRIAAAMGVDGDHLLSLHQVHSAAAVRVSGPWTGARPQADGIVTTAPGLAVSALAADCAPVLFADAEARVVAAAHAGWKGALGGVLEATLDAMVEAGAVRARIVCAIGPCIGQESYEVGPEFSARFLKEDPTNARFFAPGQGDRAHFDLKAYCGARLAQAGAASVDTLSQDTCAMPAQYFSNRRAVKNAEGDYGRNLSVILLTR
jgi:hypothetical protein